MAIGPELPEVPAKLRAECKDPGVGEIANTDDVVEEIGSQRVYAACSRRKHRDSLKFYDGVRLKYRTPK